MNDVLVVDVANVVGSRPDGWWRDRRGAAERLLAQLAPVVGQDLTDPSGDRLRSVRVVAVVEGQARTAQGPEEVVVRVARSDGDAEVVACTREACAAAHVVLVVTADRGLRERLPPEARVAGPGWLNALLGR